MNSGEVAPGVLFVGINPVCSHHLLQQRYGLGHLEIAIPLAALCPKFGHFCLKDSSPQMRLISCNCLKILVITGETALYTR